MISASMRRRNVALDLAGEIEWSALWVWLLGFGLVVYLGLEGGGYDPLVHDQVGIAAWWVLAAAVLVGAMPRLRPGPIGWAALGLLLGFVLWNALSLTWTESNEKTLADVALVVTYLGVLLLAVFSCGREGPRRLLGGVAAGIAVIALVALASRLHPDWFSEADQKARFLLDSERLSYPLNYWNGLAALAAMGLLLLLDIATRGRYVLTRALAAAALPALTLTIFYTLSRGGIAAAGIGLALYLALAHDRLPKVATLISAGAGGALLISAANSRDELREGLLNSTARSQGDEMLALTLLICLAVGAVQALLSVGLGGRRRPGWTRVPPRPALFATGASVLVLAVVALAFDAPSRAVDGWGEFKQGGGPGSGPGRLSSVAGQNRYQFWSAAARENATAPLIGTGAGTFELWWTREGEGREIVHDAHSLYMQTLGELGVVGLALLAAFLALILGGGVRRVLRAGRERSALAAAVAACTVLCITAAVDWMWQIPVLPVTMLLLSSTLVGGRPEDRIEGERDALPLGWRIGFVPFALLAIVVIAIPLASTSLVRESETDFRRGDLRGALEAARSAERTQPAAATPLLQQALVLEAAGNLGAAARAAREAIDREANGWRIWLVFSRIEARRGNAIAAVRAYRQARSLNPRSPVFDR